MSAEEIITPQPARFFKLKLTLAILGIAALLFVVGVMTTFFFIFELPFRFFFGWVLHLIAVVPGLSLPWGQLTGILACLILAILLAHRFIVWWLSAKNRESGWEMRKTIAVISLLLLGSLAAIAISGIVHQLAWLAQDDFIVNRGRSQAQTDMYARTRDLLAAVEKFRNTEGRLPYDFDELQQSLGSECPDPWMSPGSGRVKEPFLLVHPDAPAIDEEIPVIISPPVRDRPYMIVGYETGICRMLFEQKFQEWFEKYQAMLPKDQPSHE